MNQLSIPNPVPKQSSNSVVWHHRIRNNKQQGERDLWKRQANKQANAQNSKSQKETREQKMGTVPCSKQVWDVLRRRLARF